MCANKQRVRLIQVPSICMKRVFLVISAKEHLHYHIIRKHRYIHYAEIYLDTNIFKQTIFDITSKILSVLYFHLVINALQSFMSIWITITNSWVG